VDQREHAGADYGKDGHGLGEAADGVAPLLLEQQQNCRDERAGVADAYPPNKIDDGESPSDGDVKPQMPTPLRNSHVSAVNSMMQRLPAKVKPKSQNRGVWGVSTMREMTLVTDLKVYPGAITRNSPVFGSSCGSSAGNSGLVAILR
jgi:hypothetical protein